MVQKKLHDEYGPYWSRKGLKFVEGLPLLSQDAEDVEYYVKNLCRYTKQKPLRYRNKARLQPIITSSPFEMVSLDFVHLEKSSGVFEYILVIIDHFTRYAQTFVVFL